jgi:hypothetical protein
MATELSKFLTPAIYLLGAGVRYPQHLTPETVGVATKCNRIFTNLPQADVDQLQECVRTKCVSLWSMYQDNRTRLENYTEVIQIIMDAASQERPVAWLSPGHPVIFDAVSAGLRKAAETQGWGVRAVASISCIDTLLADLGYDPAGGLLIHDATSLVRSKMSLNPRIALLMLQPAAFDSDLPHTSPTSADPDLSRLGEYLFHFYPREHRCVFVRSSTDFGRPCKTTWVELCKFASLSFKDVRGSSLFIPAFLGLDEHGIVYAFTLWRIKSACQSNAL